MGSSGVLNYVDCSVGFRLQAPPTGARILSAGLRCALLNKSAAKRQPHARSAFMADLGKFAMADDKVGPSILLCVPFVPGVCIKDGAEDLPWLSLHFLFRNMVAAFLHCLTAPCTLSFWSIFKVPKTSFAEQATWTLHVLS